MITDLNSKLESGWNPFLECISANYYTKLVDTIPIFLRVAEKELKDTLRSYKSFTKTLIEWLEKKNSSDILSCLFTKQMTLDYLHYVYMDKNVSTRTYNNYVKFYRRFWNWLIENDYAAENYFNEIKLKPKQTKKRILVLAETRKVIMEHLNSTGQKEFATICKLVFTSLIRPKEIRKMQVKHIFWDKRVIFIPGENAKIIRGDFQQ